ncbi:hypothetical protein ACJ7VE_03645 [Streptomyces sp. PB17]|uniref:hypothetical protein n=1 Tax=Streptomyces sp. PB17 TaxID=3384158 RepID=UPI0038B6282D
MPKSSRMSRRTWAAAWVLLGAAGIATTAALNASPSPDPQPGRNEKPVSAECAGYIARIETQLAENRQEGSDDDGVLAFTRSRSGAEDCDDEVRDHFSGDRRAVAPEPESVPTRVYSSCLAVDTEPAPAGGDPCGGR